MSDSSNFFANAPTLICFTLYDLLDPIDILALTKVCQKTRATAMEYFRRRPHLRQPLVFDYGKLEFGRRIGFERKKKEGVARGRIIFKNLKSLKLSVADYDRLMLLYKPQFEITHIKMRVLDEDLVTTMKLNNFEGCCKEINQVMIVDMDKCDLSSERLGEVLNCFDPLVVHFNGNFKRNVINGQALPARIQNLHITENPINPSEGSALGFEDLKKILESWSTTTEEGMLMEQPIYLWSNFNFEGNYRRLDLDKCNLSAAEITKLKKIACNRLGINQIINFHNVDNESLIASCRAVPPHFHEPGANLPIERAVDAKGINDWGLISFFQANGYVGIVAQEMAVSPFVRIGEPAMNAPSLMSLSLNIHPFPEYVTARLPYTVLRDEVPPKQSRKRHAQPANGYQNPFFPFFH